MQSRAQTHTVPIVLVVAAVATVGWSTVGVAQTADSQDGHVDLPAPTVRPSIDGVPAEVLDDVEMLLSAIHGVPDRAVFEAQVPDARIVLMAVALDADAMPMQRPQALWALAQWSDDESLAVIASVLDEAAQSGDDRLVHHALAALGQSFDDRATGLIEPYVYAGDVQIRLSAVSALGHIDGPRSIAVLEGSLQGERNEVVRERIDEALTRAR